MSTAAMPPTSLPEQIAERVAQAAHRRRHIEQSREKDAEAERDIADEIGFFDADNLTLKLSNIQLPESYLHSKFNGERITYESNIFVKNNEKNHKFEHIL